MSPVIGAIVNGVFSMRRATSCASRAPWRKAFLPTRHSTIVTPRAKRSAGIDLALVIPILLGRCIADRCRSSESSGGQRREIQESCDPEVEQPELSIGPSDDVVRLDIAVDDPSPLRISESFENVKPKPHHLVLLERPSTHGLADRLARDFLLSEPNELSSLRAGQYASFLHLGDSCGLHLLNGENLTPNSLSPIAAGRDEFQDDVTVHSVSGGEDLLLPAFREWLQVRQLREVLLNPLRAHHDPHTEPARQVRTASTNR